MIMALYIVPTPIGNLQDITRRAIDVLSRVDFIIAEDSRYSQKLLNHLQIKKKIISHYRPKEETQAEKIVALLENQDGALITDSGTPAISDPGFILIRKAIAMQHPGHPPARADRLRPRPGRFGHRHAALHISRFPAPPPERLAAFFQVPGTPALYPGVLRIAAAGGKIPAKRRRGVGRAPFRPGQGIEQKA